MIRIQIELFLYRNKYIRAFYLSIAIFTIILQTVVIGYLF